MLADKQLFLVIAIVCLILLIIFKLVHVEGFNPTETPSPSGSSSGSPSGSSSGSSTPSASSGCPVVNKNWWETEAPKQVISYITGVRFPVQALTITQGINSDFQIPYIRSGETEAAGCIAVKDKSGTFTTQMCNNKDKQQLWKLVQIKTKDDFKNILSNNKDSLDNVSQNYDLVSGVQFGFFMIISQIDPSMVLASNGGNLTVQRVGNYTTQFWDITRDVPNANIAIYDTNDFTNLGSNFINSQTSNTLNTATKNVNDVISLSNNLSQSQSQLLSNQANQSLNSLTNTQTNQTNKSHPFNINLNLNEKSLMSFLGSFDQSGKNLSDIVSGTSSSIAPEGFDPINVNSSGSSSSNNQTCKPCPSILTDYIAKNNIPCLGCKL